MKYTSRLVYDWRKVDPVQYLGQGIGRGANAVRANRHWLLAGLAGWTAVCLIAIVDIGFQRVVQGQPFAESWRQIIASVWMIMPGAVLSLLVFAAFRRFVRSGRRFRANVQVYVAVGLAYWLAWSFVDAGLTHLGLVPIIPDEEASFGAALRTSLAGLAFNAIVLYAVMAVVYEAVQYMQEARRQEVRTARLQTELSRARTAALSAQLNPHFLFNTLHVASGLMNTDVRAARRVLADLGELIRDSLSRDDHQLVSLAEEIRLVERYTEIQKARFGDRLAVDFEFDSDALSACVPPLILQPLVENAVQHGIARSEDGGWIRIIARRTHGRLSLSVVNSGPIVRIAPPESERERIGIGGVRARLQLIFGSEGSLDLSYPASGGFKVEANIPDLTGIGDAHLRTTWRSLAS